MLEGVIAHPLVLRARVRASFWRARVSQPSAARYCRRFEEYACAGKTFRSSSTIVENGPGRVGAAVAGEARRCRFAAERPGSLARLG